MGNQVQACMEPLTIESDELTIVRVVDAPIMDSMSANVSGWKLGDELHVSSMRQVQGLQPLSWRYRDNHKKTWPSGYRFQSPKTSMLARVENPKGGEVQCVLQVPSNPDDRNVENIRLDTMDAATTTSYASRFNMMMVQGMGHSANPHDQPEAFPMVKVCAPVGCEVITSTDPANLPRGSACTLALYPSRDVRKFVFEGHEEFMEVPQAFFHFAAFTSASKELVSDLQGTEDDSGNILLLDPIVFRTEKPGVSALLTSMMSTKGEKEVGPSIGSQDKVEQLFNGLHPKCGQTCNQFDPSRRGAKGKKGLCGVTCMT